MTSYRVVTAMAFYLYRKYCCLEHLLDSLKLGFRYAFGLSS
jgi:hypothetical protein